MTNLAESDLVLAEPSLQPAADLTAVSQVADTLVDLMRSFMRTRQAMMQAAEHDVEWTSHIVLRCLNSHGPMRAGAIAECLQADPSTVSRQVAAMVKEGLVRRQADPDDGRASIIVLTDQATTVLAEYDQLRNEHFADMLAGWDAGEIDSFAAQLARFAASYQSKSDDLLINHVTKAAEAHRRMRSTN